MSEWVTLKAEDGHELSGYLARPEGEAIGSLVVVQEIFGVNEHIRHVVDGFARDGFVALAPALFDRIEKGLEFGYEGQDMQQARDCRQKLTPEVALLDVAAAFHRLEKEGKGIGVIGYCFGGLMAWLSATRGKQVKMQPGCCVGYYAGGIGSVATEEPACPVMLHFGADDTHIGQDQVDAVRKAHAQHKGEVQIFVYEGAGHGFTCDARSSFNPAASKLARERSLEFLKKHLA